MIIIPIEHELLLGVDDEDDEDAPKRSKGLHASGIYGPLYEKLNPQRYDKRDKSGKKLPMNMLRIQAGFTLEDIMEPLLARTLLGARPPEMRAPHHKTCPNRKKRMPKGEVCWCGAGIYFSPDYLFDEEDGLRLGEFKMTWMSTKGSEKLRDRKFDKYLCQMKIYCHWLGIRKARIYIFFINGAWHDNGFDPVLLAWDIEFTPRELETNYNMLMRFARKENMINAAK